MINEGEKKNKISSATQDCAHSLGNVSNLFLLKVQVFCVCLLEICDLNRTGLVTK